MNTNKDWVDALKPKLEIFKDIEAKLISEYSSGEEVFPPKDLIFNAFKMTPLSSVSTFDSSRSQIIILVI